MVVERKLRFARAVAYDRNGRRIQLPAGVASVTASPLMEAEAVLYESPGEVEIQLAPGEVGRSIQAGYASAVTLH
jgi:hypothetical protein